MPGVMAVVVVVWGSAFAIIQILLEDLSPLGLAGGRVLLTAVAFTVALPFVRDRPAPIAVRHDRWSLVAAGVLGLAAYNVGLAYGSQHVDAGAAGIVVSTSPVIVALLARIFLDEPIGPQRGLGMALALAGVGVIVVAGGDGLDAGRVVGVAALTGAPVAWAGYTVIVKSLRARYDAVRLNTYGAWVASLVCLPLVVTSWDSYRALDVDEWALLGYLAGIGGGVTVLLYSWSLRRWSAAGLSSFLFLVPVAAVAWDWLLRGERPEPALVGGGTLVVAGLVLVWRSRPVLGWVPALVHSLRRGRPPTMEISR